MTRDFALDQVLTAIEGSGGVMSTVASRLNCHWTTADRYVHLWVSTREAFEAEQEEFLDDCENLLRENVRLAKKEQEETGKPVDAADAKWVLARKGKDRGYVERTEQEQRGHVTITFVSNVDDDRL